MKYLSLMLLGSLLIAVDIHEPGRLETCTVPTDLNTDYIGFSNGYSIDTRLGEPVLPADLRIDGYEGGPGYYLLQVKGPVYSSWIDQLKALGIDVIVYIPNYSFIVYAGPEQLDRSRSLDFVKWIGVYQPAYKLQKELLDARGQGRVVMQLYPRANLKAFTDRIAALGFEIVLVTESDLCKSVEVTCDLSRVPELARFPDVVWMQRWTEPTLVNDQSQWVCMTGYKASGPGADSVYRRSWTKGIRGRGMILCLTDSGITTAHRQFYDSAYPITAPGIFTNHRKIIAYKLYGTAAFGDVSNVSWHGTHTDGTTAGNDTTYGTSAYDGISKEARLYHVDIANATGGLVVPTDLTAMYDTIYLGRGLPFQILQHSGSWGWGNSSGTYLLQDASTDAYSYKYPRLLNIYAAGNETSTRTLRNPGISKNSITVGATGNGTSSNTIASFSSRGPTQDNRIKPNLCAPGVNLYSASGSGTNGYNPLSGTSMATPSVNGAIGLMRHYLTAGYYPSGAAVAGDSIRYISANLLRAMAIVSCDPNIGSYVPPEFNAGWGRIDAESVLYYTGDLRKLIIKDDTSGVTTGVSRVDSFMVNSAIPLRISVVWTDTAAAPSATRTLINNINVQLTNPTGTNYRGNIYTAGQSTANPTTWDTLNVEECFRLNAPATGKWRLTVTGASIPNGPMGYAFAVTGDVSRILIGVDESTRPVAVPIGSMTYGTISRGRIELKVNLLSRGLVEARIYDLTGRIVERFGSVTLPAGESVIGHETKLPSGVYFLEVRTATDAKIGKLLVIR